MSKTRIVDFLAVAQQLKEITAEQLRDGYMTFDFDWNRTIDEDSHGIRHEFVVMRKTAHGTYIVIDPESERR